MKDWGFEKDIHVVSDWFSSRYRDEFIDLDSTTFLQRKLDDSPTKSANVSMQMRFINSASRRRKEVLSVNVTRGGRRLIESRTTMQRCNDKDRRLVFVSIFMIFFLVLFAYIFSFRLFHFLFLLLCVNSIWRSVWFFSSFTFFAGWRIVTEFLFPLHCFV